MLFEWTARNPGAALYDGGPPRELLRLEQPFQNHNAGHMSFNPNAAPGSADFGMLYVAVADGGSGGDPLKLGPSESDLVIVWRVPALGLEHDEHGRIGPLPYRRTGGHTGPYGMAYFAGEGIAAGDFGVRSSFDVVPTLVDLLGEKPPPGLSGERLFAATNGR